MYHKIYFVVFQVSNPKTMTDMLGSFEYTIWGALIVAILYVAVCLKRPHAERTKEVLTSTLKGFGVEAVFWFALIFIATQLATRNVVVWHVFANVVETPFLPISLANISALLVPPVFTMHEYSHGHVDYRKHVLVGLCALTVLVWLYCWTIIVH